MPIKVAKQRSNGRGFAFDLRFFQNLNGEDKNEIRAAVTPDHRDYAALMVTVAPQFAAATAQGHAAQQPTRATQPSPRPPPGAAGRPSWAQ